MTAVDLDALDAARAAIREELGRYWENDVPDWALNAVVRGIALPDLIAEARRYRALREAVEGLASLVDQGQAWTGDSLARRLRATLARATVDGTA